MRIVDLTMTIEEGMTTYPTPWHPVVEVTQLGRHGIEGRETRKMVIGTHTGTHIDAPRHFISGGNTVDDISPNRLCGPATVLDFSLIAPGSSVSVADLEVAVNGCSLERVLLRFDGHRRLGSRSYYTDQPWLTLDAADWLVSNGCILLGMDVAMPDRPGDDDMPVHKLLLGAEVVIVEYLVNLDDIKVPEFELIVAPLKIKGGDGAPARCFAIIRD